MRGNLLILTSLVSKLESSYSSILYKEPYKGLSLECDIALVSWPELEEQWMGEPLAGPSDKVVTLLLLRGRVLCGCFGNMCSHHFWSDRLVP